MKYSTDVLWYKIDNCESSSCQSYEFMRAKEKEKELKKILKIESDDAAKEDRSESDSCQGKNVIKSKDLLHQEMKLLKIKDDISEMSEESEISIIEKEDEEFFGVSIDDNVGDDISEKDIHQYVEEFLEEYADKRLEEEADSFKHKKKKVKMARILALPRNNKPLKNLIFIA